MRFLTVLLLAASVSACEKPEIKGPPAEKVPETSAKATLPPVPSFEIKGDVMRYRVESQKHMGSQVTIKGYITYVYDCVSEIQQVGESDEVTKSRIEKNPELCDKAHFYMGDSPDTDPDFSIWVVEVPTTLRKDQIDMMDKEAIAAHNAKIVPHQKGDQVVVRGLWTTEAGGFKNLKGLVQFEQMKNLSTPAEEPAE